MEIYLTHDQSTRRITDILLNWSWSGDKSTLVRQLVAEIVFDESTAESTAGATTAPTNSATRRRKVSPARSAPTMRSPLCRCRRPA